MPRTRNPYPAEFREQIVALARAGRSVEDLAREFEPCVATIHGWIKQADRDGGRRVDGLTSEEHDELRRLRKENRQPRTSSRVGWFRSGKCPPGPPRGTYSSFASLAAVSERSSKIHRIWLPLAPCSYMSSHCLRL